MTTAKPNGQHAGESNVNLILAIKQNVRGEIAAVDAKIAKREKEIAELREERTMLIHLAGATGVAITPESSLPDKALVDPSVSG